MSVASVSTRFMQTSRIYTLVLIILLFGGVFVVGFMGPVLRVQRGQWNLYSRGSYNQIQRHYTTARDGDMTIGLNQSQIEDDGYKLGHTSRMPSILRAIKSTVSSTINKKVPGTLILVRHGESAWNSNKTFTGWVDVDLSDRGRKECEHAARLLLERGYTVDVVYTSRLKRAIRSTWILLKELNQIYRAVYKSWRLNERMYGSLEGLSKPQLAKELGETVVQQWRAGLLARPPPMSQDHPYFHARERKYADLATEDIPLTESLQDTMERTLPLWFSKILPSLKNGENVMIVAHGNSLRGIVKHIDNLTADQIQKTGIPNGIPLVYKFDLNMKPIKQENADGFLSGEFLEKKGLLRAALAEEERLSRAVPGYEDYAASADDTYTSFSPSALALIRGLKKLDQQRMFFNSSEQPTVASEETKAMMTYASSNATNVILSPKDISKGPVLVIIRHGKTEHNKLGLFTGWEDATLAPEGRVEAKKAGLLLKAHNIEFDIVYTSWLSRAIETAWIVLDELDSLWLPILKTWRLNERMYGSLTGFSKRMIKQQHGEKQFKMWRRGYDTRPPPISSFSVHYPGNDDRYVKYVKDIRPSFSESLIRSLSHRRVEIHKKFPKTESLKDCMDRTIPYFCNVIVPGSIAKGKNVLIASSENAIRGLLMHLCEIPPERIHEVEIPTGLPMVYDSDRKSIRLLDDGEGSSQLPWERYDFGTAPDLLFKP